MLRCMLRSDVGRRALALQQDLNHPSAMVGGHGIEGVWGRRQMIRESLVCAARLAGGLAVAALGACAADRDPPPGEPSFYRSMAAADARPDAATAAAMISGYRRNNNLSEVTVDP